MLSSYRIPSNSHKRRQNTLNVNSLNHENEDRRSSSSPTYSKRPQRTSKEFVANKKSKNSGNGGDADHSKHQTIFLLREVFL